MTLEGRTDIGPATWGQGAATELLEGAASDPLPWSPAPTSAEMAPRVRRRREIGPWLAAGWLALIVLLAAMADLLPLRSFAATSAELNRRPAFSLDEPLGTDALGRSQLSRVIFGARVSLLVSFGGVLVGSAVGTAVGLVSGYFRGIYDRVASTCLDTLLAFPPLILLLALTAVLDPSVPTLIIGLGLLAIPYFARIARAHALTVTQREFVVSARVTGATERQIILREVLPNILPAIVSMTLVIVAALMVAEGSLSFLGLGVPSPQPSWGGMMAQGRQSIQTDPHLVLVPAAALFLTVLSLNVLGQRWHRGFDVRSRSM